MQHDLHHQPRSPVHVQTLTEVQNQATSTTLRLAGSIHICICGNNNDTDWKSTVSRYSTSCYMVVRIHVQFDQAGHSARMQHPQSCIYAPALSDGTKQARTGLGTIVPRSLVTRPVSQAYLGCTHSHILLHKTLPGQAKHGICKKCLGKASSRSPAIRADRYTTKSAQAYMKK